MEGSKGIVFWVAATAAIIGILTLGGLEGLVNGLQTVWGTKATRVEVPPPAFWTDEYVESTILKLQEIEIAEPLEVEFDNTEWSYWDNYGSACWTAEEQFLYDQSDGTVELLNSEGKETENINEACEILKAKWLDPYSGDSFEKLENFTLGHTVPLKEIHVSGGALWSRDMKRDYANFLGFSVHALPIKNSELEDRDSQDPRGWMPTNERFHCAYLIYWVDIKSQWGLTMDKDEFNFIERELTSCD